MGGFPSKQMVNAVGGCARARAVTPGDRLWTLDEDRTVETAVTEVTAVKTRDLVEVVTAGGTLLAAPDQLLVAESGPVPARAALGSEIAWTQARKLCRERLDIRPGYEFGYFVGATCADGTVGRGYVSLVVNDRAFATKYADCLSTATGLAARLEAVTRPSGFLMSDVPGFRVRVVSSFLVDAVRQYVGGDAHHMRQRFPRVVLRDQITFAGFLDGYADGDGHRLGNWDARAIVSANVPFLTELAQIVGARFTPSEVPGRASRLYVSDRWPSRGTFKAEHHPLLPGERGWARVEAVRPRKAVGTKPFTLYSYRLAPHPGFLVNGHLVRMDW
ncbi:hypothetical protein ACIQUQ_09165 [Streptomyces sp. NPDC101118]|uniref:hypothetical protein n=1 Tax=Streptomyces sp. NPDC101118 TaxID=3366109 RepID=UPI0037FA3809